MSVAAVRADLEAYDTAPEAVLRGAVAHASALAPALTELMSLVRDRFFLLPHEQRFLFNGLHVAAAAGETSLYRPLMQMFRCPADDLDPRISLPLISTLRQIVLGLFDGDIKPLIETVEDRNADCFIRWGLFGVLARTVLDGVVPRATAAAVTERFGRERLAEPDDPAWAAWVTTIVVLGFSEQADLVRAAAADGLFGEGLIEEGWEAELERVGADPAAARALLLEQHSPGDDPIDAFVQSFLRPPELADEDDENDEDDDLEDAVLDLLEQEDLLAEDLLEDPDLDWPAADERPAGVGLDGEERAWLAGFLTSPQVPETTMTLDELDGFFTALVINLNPIMPSTYMKTVWGTDDGEGPVYSSDEQLHFVLDLLTRHWNAVAASFASEQGPRPLLRRRRGEDDGLAWADGFMRGAHMDREPWEDLANDGNAALLLAPIGILSRTRDADDLPDDLRGEDTRKNAISVLPEILTALYRYFRDDTVARKLRHKPPPARRRKVGRNQPCPCGSGRKYKACCGAAGGTAAAPQKTPLEP